MIKSKAFPPSNLYTVSQTMPPSGRPSYLIRLSSVEN
ncbi:triosephosphate isomerase [Pluralibacter gergoviae]|nr:triosephosphate isomerase [Pluralibacter gergoviae]MBL3693665.1 triosephosphate isomerase [Pluralibacter gergoviae]